MSDNNRNFSRRRRGGMRFRPSGGLKPNLDQGATEARAELGKEKAVNETVYDTSRHEHEIRRSENVAAGLPPQGAPETEPAPTKHDFRQPDLSAPEEAKEEFRPVEIKPAQGIVESIKAAATKMIKKVQRLIRPVKKSHKEVIINSESLETRVAVSEDGRLEEFNIERTTEERLVGSIFKGKVRNLEDGLKAAFVDIGFEKNAFLHYWDIVPTNLDSGVELVEREGKRRERPRFTQKDIPRLYSPGAEIIVQVTKGPIGTKGPRVTTNRGSRCAVRSTPE